MSIKGEESNLNRMMGEGKFPAPVSDYRVEAIQYNPRFVGPNGSRGPVLAVEQVPSGPDSGTIIAFAPAAETLEHAVRCLAHELFRFHPTQSENHDLCYQYAQAAVRVYNGGRYNGPSVEVEELGADLGAGFDAEADADLPPTTSQSAPTPTPNPRPDREADAEVPTPTPTPNPRPDREDIDPNQEARRNKDQRIEDRAERSEERLEKEAREKERQDQIAVLEYQLDSLEALNQEAWATLEQLELALEENVDLQLAADAAHIRSGTVGGTYKLMLKLRQNGFDQSRMQAAFQAEIDAYRHQIANAPFDEKFNPKGVSEKLFEDFGKAMEIAADDGSQLSLGAARLYDQYGDELEDVRDGIAQELYPAKGGAPVFFDEMDEIQKSHVEREILARANQDLGSLKLATTLGGIANGGFVLLMALAAWDSVEKAENFYGELSRQIFNISVNEILVIRAAKALPRLLRFLGLNIGTKPVPHLIVSGAILIVLSYGLGKALDYGTKLSGIFENFLRETRRPPNAVQRRRASRERQSGKRDDT